MKTPESQQSAASEAGQNQYRCAWCGNVYDLERNEDWSEEKARAEKERDFPGVPMEQCVVVCDDCYQKCRPDTHPKEYEAYKAERN
jgi:hypothetical protein